MIYNPRKGRIKVSFALYSLTYVDFMGALFSKVLPIDIDFDSVQNTVIITGVSSDFEELKEGELTPFYMVKWDTASGGIISFEKA